MDVEKLKKKAAAWDMVFACCLKNGVVGAVDEICEWITAKSQELVEVNSSTSPNKRSVKLNHIGHSIKYGECQSMRDYCRDCKCWI